MGLALTVRAEISGAAALFHALDGARASEAGLSFAAIDVEGEVFAFGERSGAGVFAHGRTESAAQRSHDGLMQGEDARGWKNLHRFGGMNAGEEEGFGGVDVAEAGQTLLIEEEELGGLVRPEGGGGEAGGREGARKRFGAEGGEIPGVEQPDAAEGAGVGEDEAGVAGELQNEAGGGGKEAHVGQNFEIAGHAKVDVERAGRAAREVEENVFGAARYGFDPAAFDRALEFAGRVREGDTRAQDSHGEDAASGNGGADFTADGFDFRQLRHWLQGRVTR